MGSGPGVVDADLEAPVLMLDLHPCVLSAAVSSRVQRGLDRNPEGRRLDSRRQWRKVGRFHTNMHRVSLWGLQGGDLLAYRRDESQLVQRGRAHVVDEPADVAH